MTLDLAGLGLQDAHVASIAEHIWKSHSVSDIVLTGNSSITDVGATALLKGLQGHSRHNPLCECGERLDDAESAGCPVLDAPGTLTKVVLGGTGVGGYVKGHIAMVCKERALRLATSALLEGWHPPKLLVSGEVTCLRGQGLTDADVAKLAPLLGHSELVGHLDLSDNPLVTAKSAIPIANALRDNPRLHTVSLQGTRLLASPKAPEMAAAADGNALALGLSTLGANEPGWPGWGSCGGGGWGTETLLSS